ncbi:MAG: MFS transporter [Bacteroidia bacterium]|nr:MFS transporter [Bacteroidia bacterium]
MQKPRLSLGDIINMSLGFMGIQFGFALQNANASRILQTFGADVEHLSLFWLAAPLTGMIIQPIIGHYSDRTWTKLGRRRPFILVGAILASLALCLMPNSGYFAAVIPPMFIGAGILMIMDASINVSMEPFRALVADNLNTEQRTTGFSVQTILIGLGAVIGSWLPYVLAEWIGIPAEAPEGEIPQNLMFSFYVGAAFFILTILWTVSRTKEYSPEQLAKFYADEEPEDHSAGLGQIFKDFASMPKTMKQLGVVQFFSWFALFSMWVFSTPAVAQHIYDLPASDTSSAMYNKAGNWIGFIFGIYNLVATVMAFFLPVIAMKIGRRMTHAICLVAGGLGLVSMYFAPNPEFLIVSMVGVGIAWASILAMPYSILAGSIPPAKMGIYMGIFNFFITGPQILNGIIGGPVIKYVYGNEAIYALLVAGIFMILGAFSVMFVEDKDDPVGKNSPLLNYFQRK